MNKIKNFPGIIEIYTDEEKTVHKYTNYTLWRWLIRLSLILIITPLFPLIPVIYFLFYYGITKTNVDIANALKKGDKVEMSGSKSILSSGYQVTIYRQNSEEILKNIVVFGFLKKIAKFLLKVALVIIGLIVLWIIIYSIFIEPKQDGIGEYNFMCSHVKNDESNKLLLAKNKKIKKSVTTCIKLTINENKSIFKISEATNLDFISMANIYKAEGKQALYDEVSKLPLEQERMDLALKMIGELE